MRSADGWEAFPFPEFSWYEWNERLGAVRSWRRRNGRGNYPSTPKTLRPASGSVYVTWTLLDDSGKRHGISLHLLVCTKYHGPKPIGMEVCHNDGNSTNNSPENLRWDTHSSNVLDAVRHGTHVNNRGELCGAAKLSEKDVTEIFHSQGKSGVYLANKFGVSKSRISEIRSRNTWKHLLGEAKSDNRV